MDSRPWSSGHQFDAVLVKQNPAPRAWAQANAVSTSLAEPLRPLPKRSKKLAVVLWDRTKNHSADIHCCFRFCRSELSNQLPFSETYRTPITNASLM